MSFFGLIKDPNDYTVKNNRTGEETSVRDAKQLEKMALQEQRKPDNEKPKPLFERLTSRNYS